MRTAIAALLLPLAMAACATNERPGTIPPRSPVTAQEKVADYPLDVYDPLEGINRGIYQFNTRFDRWIFLPIVSSYEWIMPDPLEQGVSNFFNNLGEFRNGVNGALQARGDVFGTALSRLMVNSTLGMLGLFDFATKSGIPERREDFGQTLGWWGAGPGPYLVLPILGPSDLRDAGGTAVDTVLSTTLPVVQQVNDEVYVNPAVYALYFTDQRHQVPFRYYRSGSPFEYDLVRFLFVKKRELDILK